MRGLVRGLWDIIAYAEMLALEFFFGALKFGWGLFLLWPEHSFAATSWRVLETFAPEDAFGIWLVFIGLLQIVGVASRGKGLRALAVGLAIPTWSLISFSLFTVTVHSPGWFLFLILVWANLWMFLRVRRRPE